MNMDKLLKIGLFGASGKMGQAIIEKIKDFSNQAFVNATFTRQNHVFDLLDFCKNSDVIIDFSSPDSLHELLKSCVMHKKNIVIGTTGFSEYDMEELKTASNKIGILYSPNMSKGIALISSLLSNVSKALSEEYDITILDMHHKLKKDAPSGTSLMLGSNIVKSGRKVSYTSIRAGRVPGVHQVILAGNDEVITIKHEVFDRSIFANGAIKAAIWLHNKPSGLYSIKEIYQ
jgi:4-hydroxy-tetrahydrodipicolinate reductase